MRENERQAINIPVILDTYMTSCSVTFDGFHYFYEHGATYGVGATLSNDNRHIALTLHSVTAKLRCYGNV